MENSAALNYWLNTDTIDIQNDPDLKLVKDQMLMGRKENESTTQGTVDLIFEVNKKAITKTVSIKDVIPTDNNMSITAFNLSYLDSFTIYEAVYNIQNNFNFGKFFYFVDEEIVVTYLKYPLTNYRENYFENYLLVQDYQNNIFLNPDYSHKHFDKLKENLNKILSSETGAEKYDEMYIKLADKIINKESNSFINFMSNSLLDSGSNDYEEILFFIQSLSCYNKHKIFREKELKNKFEREFKIYDLVYAGLRVLGMFGCSTTLNKLKSDNLQVPRFNYKLELNLDKDLNHCKKAKIEILNFNRDIFDYAYSEINNERLFNIFHIIPKFLSPKLLEEFNLYNDLGKYKLFENYKENNLSKENVADEENFRLLFDCLLKMFNFNHNEVNALIKFISFILNLSNLEFLNEQGKIVIKEVENIQKCLKLDDRISDNELASLFLIDIKTGQVFNSIELCKANVKNIIKDVYENLFYFVVNKINTELNPSNQNFTFNESVDENFKEIIITNNSCQNKLTISNSYDLFNLLLLENSIKYFEETKIDKMFEELKNENIQINKIEYGYDKSNKNILTTIEKINNSLINNIDQPDFIPLSNFDTEIQIDFAKLKSNNIIKSNASLISILQLMESSNQLKSSKSSNEKEITDLEAKSKIIYQIFSNKLHNDRNLIEDTLLKIKEKPKDYDFLYLINLSDNFISGYNNAVLRNHFLKSLKRFKIKSYVENICAKFNKVFTYKQFVNRFCIPVLKNSEVIPEENFKSKSKDILNSIVLDETNYILAKSMIFLNNLTFLKLMRIEKEYQSELLNNKEVDKVLAVVKAFSIRKSIEKARQSLNSKSISPINNEPNDSLIYNGFECKLYANNLLDKVFKSDPKKLSNEQFDSKAYTSNLLDGIFNNYVNDKKNSNEQFDSKAYTSNLLDGIFNSYVNDKQLCNATDKKTCLRNKIESPVETNTIEIEMKLDSDTNELVNVDLKKKSVLLHSKEKEKTKEKENEKLSIIGDEVKVMKIQGAWRAKRDKKVVGFMREKVFIIQRNFRRLLIKKYDLPDNYFYNEKFLRLQHEKYERNYLENMRVLFPAVYNEFSTISQNGEDLGGNSFTHSNSNGFKRNSNLLNSNLQHSVYEQGKIHLFAKVLDIDFMVETDEVYENLWSTSFDKVYSHCLKAFSPVQLMSLGNAHTVCLSNKGKLYTFGWNNFGQCGVPINSTVIAKDEIENDYLVEMTEYNELKPRVLNKVEGVKLPQMEEVVITKNITCGEDHTLVLDQEGKVWAFGLNLNGQLGLGHLKSCEKPTKIKSLEKHFITNIKSEGEVNFALSDKGEAFMWPCCDKNGNIMPEPVRLPLGSNNEKINSVACGNNFVLLLNQHGMVYSMGKSNQYGQLGHGDTQPKFRPTLIEFFTINNERISQISCGYKHCVAKSCIGKAYTWGLGVKGQLGHGDFNNYTLPYQVKVESPLTKIYQVSAGFRSTFFLIENRKVFYTGCDGTHSMENSPIQFTVWEKIPEFGNESNYSIVRIMNTWNKSMSIFYATIADSTTLKGINPPKLNQILSNLTSKWDTVSIDVPYIESICKYFPSSYMKKPKDFHSKR